MQLSLTKQFQQRRRRGWSECFPAQWSAYLYRGATVSAEAEPGFKH